MLFKILFIILKKSVDFSSNLDMHAFLYRIVVQVLYYIDGELVYWRTKEGSQETEATQNRVEIKEVWQTLWRNYESWKFLVSGINDRNETRLALRILCTVEYNFKTSFRKLKQKSNVGNHYHFLWCCTLSTTFKDHNTIQRIWRKL